MKKRLFALLILLVLAVGFLPGAKAAGAMFFVGVNNDIPVLLSGETSPFYANGMLYAPYTVFGAAPGGVNVSYDTEQETFALFTLSNTVVFDLAEGTMTDKAGNSVTADAIYRNGVLYLPVEQAAKQFGLTVSLLTSRSGCAVLRFKDGTEVYEDDVFLEKSELFITHMLETYGSQLPGDSVLPEEEQEESGEEDPEATTTEVYLAFAGEAVSQATLGHLEALEYVLGADVYCTFFLTEMQIRNDSQLVRDIYNNGHMIGLTVSAGETNVSDALQRANDALDSVLFCRSLMALLPVEPAEQLHLRVYGPSQTVDTVEAALEYTEYPPLLVCRSDVASMLEQLSLHNVSILQLLETDIPIKRMQEEG